VPDVVFGIVAGLCFEFVDFEFGVGVFGTLVGWVVELLSRRVAGLILPEEGVKIEPLPHYLIL
jgi:hypothetical protein